jgi:hypothetical protein
MVKINYNVLLYLVQPKPAAENVLEIYKNILPANFTDFTILYTKFNESDRIQPTNGDSNALSR